ncbi:BnaAnng03150D [Brassica napus]|uniref:BnaAnng03150D protein n=1 Tax=Brassica napus TaxID=3708 RepID=A0A078FWP2_BRANA|nr:BnaAnng03150D [Brassica napus]
MVLMVKAPPPSRCRPPPDPPPSKLLSVAFETLTSIIPPEPPDPPDSLFVLVHRLRPLASFSSDFHSVSLGALTQAWDFKSPLSDLAINSIGSAASPRPSYLSNKPCEGIVYVPLWNKSFLRKVRCDVCLLKLYLPQCEDVTLSLTLRMRSSLPLGLCVEEDNLRCRNYDLTSSFFSNL